MSPDTTRSLPRPYPGPSNDDPLTEDELSILLAIPRAAESTPDATLFRLPLGPEPSMGWIDATCAETRSIVVRLANVWKSRLSNLLDKTGEPVLGSYVGPGTIISIAAAPDLYGIFHVLAFWAIGCTAQFSSMIDTTTAINQLHKAGCKVMLCSGYDQAWIEAREKQFDGVIVQLPKEEQAHQLVKSEKQGHLSTLPWPAPQRPTPAVILHSSGTTTNPKLFRMSLYTFTIRLTETCRTHLSLAGLKRTSKTPRTHPRFIAAPFYWTSTFYYIFTHLVTATPMAFGSFVDIYQAPPGDLIDWGIALDAGAMTWPSGPARLIPRATYEAHAEFLRTLYSFSFTGSTMSKALSQVFEELKIPIVNLYGSSELGRVLYSWKPPYTHLRPCRDVSPPLIHPISDYDTDGTRHVELWITPIASPILAHYLAHGGVPLKLEPFPGDGPYKGELAVNLDDIFREVKVGDQDGSTETVYIHMGRHTDEVRLGEGGFGSIDATEYEGTIESEINSRIGGVGGCPWKLDGAQLFGNNMSCTALVIQLRLDRNFEGPDHGADPAKSLPIAELQESVERTNDVLGLAGCKRVHPGKRTLVVSSDGAVLHGPGGESVSGTFASLSMTHKSTLKRWENVYKFKPWLDALDFISKKPNSR